MPSFILATHIPVELAEPYDYHEYRYQALLRTVGMQSGKVSWFPWEAAVYTVGSIPDIPILPDLPDSLFKSVNASRRAVMDYLGTECRTITNMRNVLKKDEKKLQELDRFLEVELEYLYTYAETFWRSSLLTDAASSYPS